MTPHRTTQAAPQPEEGRVAGRIPALDGLRAVSILLVLAAHLLPLGPAVLELNSTAGLRVWRSSFSLSGFLIVRFLAGGMPVRMFVIRRLARIVPLAWTAMFALWLINGPKSPLAQNLAFVANLPPAKLMVGGEHLWSLCLEVQFYAVAALICMFPSRKTLFLVPFLCVSVTALRIYSGQPISIVTWHRIDEILVGGIVALVYCGWLGDSVKDKLSRIPLPISLLALFVCSHPLSGPLLYLRPYAAGFLLASAIYNLDRISERVLVNRVAAYIAETSYALYVIHGMLVGTWMGTGGTVEKYLKRPLLFAATFGLAHLSTFFLEKPVTRLARRVSGMPGYPTVSSSSR